MSVPIKTKMLKDLFEHHIKCHKKRHRQRHLLLNSVQSALSEDTSLVPFSAIEIAFEIV